MANNLADNDTMDDPEERRVLHAAFDSFRQYRQASHFNITHLRRQALYSLPSAHADLLCGPPFSLPDTFRLVDDAIDANADIAEAILEAGLPAFALSEQDDSWTGATTPNDLDKARSSIRQLYRDWSAEGSAERQACFEPIMRGLQTYLPQVQPAQRPQYHILVPGAGLGRLVFDICLAGYSVEGNEISYHQLITSNYILNYTQAAGQHRLFPWALTFSNHMRRADQLESVSVPDVNPGQALVAAEKEHGFARHFSERMSMSAGDFTVVYRKPENKEFFDAVTTCFFIDTAPNLIHYIETVLYCLQPGGVWINLGPLLWHFESAPTPAEREAKKDLGQSTLTHQTADSSFQGIGDPGSFELANDEVLALLKHFGFEIEEHTEMPGGASGYIQDPRSMLQNIYKPVFWVARKKDAKPSGSSSAP